MPNRPSRAARMAEEHGERIGALEVGQQNISTNLEKLADKIGDMTRKFDSALEKVHERVDDHTKTDWKSILSAVALVVTILGGMVAFAGSFYFRDLEQVRDQNEAQGIALLKYVNEGHPTTEKEIAYREQIVDLKIQNLH